MKTAYDTIKNILRTEKSSLMQTENKYLFLVGFDANKIEIKDAVEQIYNVKVIKVNTIRSHGKWRRVRYKAGMSSDWKKALVTLKEGDKIKVAIT